MAGLDLVDGTPVYDIKPYIPWDSLPLSVPPGAAPAAAAAAAKSSFSPTAVSAVVVPSWVTADSELSAVTWTDEAEATVRDAVLGQCTPLTQSQITDSASNTPTGQITCCRRGHPSGGHMEPLYSTLDDLPDVLSAIGEVISQARYDP